MFLLFIISQSLFEAAEILALSSGVHRSPIYKDNLNVGGKQMTKKELYDIYWIRRNIKRMEEKLLELETSATKITTQLSNEMKSGLSSQDKLGDVVSKMLDLQTEINDQLRRYYERVNYVERAVDALPQREAFLIRLRYLEQKSWEEICVEMHYSWKHIHRIHSEALKLLA